MNISGTLVNVTRTPTDSNTCEGCLFQISDALCDAAPSCSDVDDNGGETKQFIYVHAAPSTPPPPPPPPPAMWRRWLPLLVLAVLVILPAILSVILDHDVPRDINGEDVSWAYEDDTPVHR